MNGQLCWNGENLGNSNVGGIGEFVGNDEFLFSLFVFLWNLKKKC